MTQEIEFRKFEIKRKFGVELEMGRYKYPAKLKEIVCCAADAFYCDSDNYYVRSRGMFWHVKRDYSCKNKGHSWGHEVASPVGKTFADFIQFGEVADAIFEAGWRINRNCGLHVHVDACDFSTNQMGILLAWWLKIEDAIFGIVPKRRSGSDFCRSLKSRKKEFKPSFEGYWSLFNPLLHEKDGGVFLYDMLKPENWSPYENDDKHFALNIVPFVRHQESLRDADIWGSPTRDATVELRLPEGTLKGQTVKNWIRFFICFVESCRYREMPENMEVCRTWEEVMQILGLHHENGKFVLLSEGLLETKIWLLKRAVRYGNFQWRESAKSLLRAILEVPEATLKAAETAS